MMRGAIIHGVLLIAALIFAYQTWTREEKVEPKTGTVEVWTKSEDKIKAVLYETKDRTVRLERRSDDAGAYLWGTETRVTTIKPPRKPGEKPDPNAVGEQKTTVREFPVGKRGEEAVKNLASLRALRDLGELSEEDKEKFELTESTDTIAVVLASGERSLILGGRVYGGADRYVLDTESGKGYAVAGTIISGLHSGETGLNLRRIHAYDKDVPKQVNLVAHMAGDKELTLVRVETETEHGKKKGWADARTPDKPDQTLANLLNRIDGVRPSQYMSEIENADKLVKVATVRYRDDGGKEVGFLELYRHEVIPEPEPEPPAPDKGTDPAKPGDPKKPGDAGKKPADAKAAKGDAKKPDAKAAGDADAKAEPPKPKEPQPKITFYVKSERSRIYGRIGKSLGNLIERDLKQLVGE